MVSKLIVTEDDRREFLRLLSSANLDRPLVAEFKVFRKNRSIKQNSLMWLWFRCIEDETGNDIVTLHNYFCEKYLGWSLKTVFGDYHRKIPGTSGLDTKEFDTFLEKIRMDMQDNQNIHLPLPDEQGWDEFYAKYMEWK